MLGYEFSLLCQDESQLMKFWNLDGALRNFAQLCAMFLLHTVKGTSHWSHRVLFHPSGWPSQEGCENGPDLSFQAFASQDLLLQGNGLHLPWPWHRCPEPIFCCSCLKHERFGCDLLKRSSFWIYKAHPHEIIAGLLSFAKGHEVFGLAPLGERAFWGGSWEDTEMPLTLAESCCTTCISNWAKIGERFYIGIIWNSKFRCFQYIGDPPLIGSWASMKPCDGTSVDQIELEYLPSTNSPSSNLPQALHRHGEAQSMRSKAPQAGFEACPGLIHLGSSGTSWSQNS